MTQHMTESYYIMPSLDQALASIEDQDRVPGLHKTPTDLAS